MTDDREDSPSGDSGDRGDVPRESGRVERFRPRAVMPSSRGQPVGLVSGPRPTYPGPAAFAVGGIAIVAAVFIYRHFAERDVQVKRDAILAESRQLADAVLPDWNAFRETAERILHEAAVRGPADEKAPEVPWDFRTRDGVYVRMPTRDVRSAASMRHGIEVSKRDAFIGCLMRPDAARDSGTAFAEQPWNLEDAYHSMRIVGESWTNEVADTTGDLRIRAFRDQFERAKAEELPKAREIFRRAEFLLVVLDDDSEGAKTLPDGGAVTTAALALTPHPTRIVLHSLKEKRTVAWTTLVVDAGHFTVHGQTPTDPGIQAAMQRQTTNCALADEARKFFKLSE